jgi:hypothetical protein
MAAIDPDSARARARRWRLTVWYLACALGALHVYLHWIDWPSRPIWEPQAPLWRSQLIVSLCLAGAGAGLRPGLGGFLAGLALNVLLAGAMLLALGVAIVAGFS